MALYRPSFTRPPYQPQPLRRFALRVAAASATPGAPVIGTAVAGILAMSGAWTDGATNGTTTINHDAQLEIDGVAGAVIESIGLTSPYTFTGLSVGASVRVRFRTIGQLGVAEAISDWSAYSNAVTVLAPTPSTSTTSSGPTRPRMTGRVRGTARVGGAHRAVGTRRLVTR